MRNILSGFVIATAFLLTPLAAAATGDPVTIEVTDRKDWQGKAGDQIAELKFLLSEVERKTQDSF